MERLASQPPEKRRKNQATEALRRTDILTPVNERTS
jgi:hypothetical protein